MFINEGSINLARVNYLLSLELNKDNLAKRIGRAKKNGKYEEYLALRLVKAHLDFVIANGGVDNG